MNPHWPNVQVVSRHLLGFFDSKREKQCQSTYEASLRNLAKPAPDVHVESLAALSVRGFSIVYRGRLHSVRDEGFNFSLGSRHFGLTAFNVRIG
jgi:hypothetical protein